MEFKIRCWSPFHWRRVGRDYLVLDSGYLANAVSSRTAIQVTT